MEMLILEIENRNESLSIKLVNVVTEAHIQTHTHTHMYSYTCTYTRTQAQTCNIHTYYTLKIICNLNGNLHFSRCFIAYTKIPKKTIICYTARKMKLEQEKDVEEFIHCGGFLCQ